MQKKQQRLSGTVVVVACCFSGRHAPFFVFSLAFTLVKELEVEANIPAIY